MKVFLHEMASLSEVFPSGEVLNATVARRVEGGYIIKLDGTELFARSDLDLAFGQVLQLRTLELSPAQWVLKVIVSPESQEAAPNEGLIPRIEPMDHSEAHVVLKALAQLNLPMTKDRLDCLTDLIKDLLISRKTLVPEGAEDPLPPELKDLTQALTRVLEDLPEDEIGDTSELWKRERTETPAHRNSIGSEVIKNYLATKIITLAVNNSLDKQISFFALPLPFFNTVFLKVERDTATEDEDSPLMLSFIIDTHNLGTVKPVLGYLKGITHAQITFDRSSSLEVAKSAIAQLGKDASPILKTLKLQTGKVSRKDFFLGSIKEDNLKGVDVKI